MESIVGLYMTVLTVSSNTNLFPISIKVLSLTQHSNNCVKVFYYIIPDILQDIVRGITLTDTQRKPIGIFIHVLCLTADYFTISLMVDDVTSI